MKSLENKVAIVTGAGSGIGKAICLLYAKEGAKIVVSDISEKAGNETVSEIKDAGGKAIFVKADSSKPEDNKNLVEQTVKEFGGLHVAVNNAGIGGPIGPVGEYPIDGWDKVIAINLSGVFYGMRYQIPANVKIRRRQHCKYGIHSWKSWNKRFCCLCGSETWSDWFDRIGCFGIR